MNKEKEKTAEELAYYVKSDLDIQEIVKKFQHDLQELLLQSKDLLPEDERYKNADKNILTVEIPDDKQRIDLAYLQHKYKLGYRYIDDLFRQNIFPYSGSDLCEALYFQAVCILCKDRKEIDEYFANLKREREAAQKKEEQTTE